MIKSVKRLGAAVLSAVMMLTAVATPLGDNLPAVRESTSLTASASDWKRTFINNKSDSRINSAINAISNQANVSKCNQSGKSVSDIIRFMIFDSKYAVYGNNAILDKYTNAKYPTCQGSFPEETVYGNKVSFTKAVGCLWYARYVTTVIYGKEGSKIYINKNSVTAIRDFITKNAQAGEHIRMEGGTYQHSIVYVSSDSNGFYYLDYFGNSGDKPRFTYTTYTDFYNHVKSMSTLYLANANDGSTPSTDNVKLTGTSYKIANTVSDTNAFVVTDVYKPSNYKLTKAGIRIRRYDGSYDNGWSEFHNTASTWTGYDYMRISYDMNSEVKITLRHGTKYYYKFYAVIEGKEYWSPEQSFTTTGSHSYGSWYTKTSATCTSGGTEERKCSCGVTETRSTSALGHNYGSWSTVTSATCTSGGSEKRTCTRCSVSETRSTSALGHNYGSTYFEADHPHKYAHLCQRCGYKEFTGGNLDYYYLCSTCTHLTKPEITKITGDLVDNSEITIEWAASDSDKLSHYWINIVDPNEQMIVSENNGTYNFYSFIPESSGTYTVTIFATPIGTKNGDGSVIAEIAIKINCDHDYNIEVVNPTYDNEGYNLHKCTKCGYSYKNNITEKLDKAAIKNLLCNEKHQERVKLSWDKLAYEPKCEAEVYENNQWKLCSKYFTDNGKTTIYGLNGATEYKFRLRLYVVSTDIDGNESKSYSDYSEVITIKTPCDYEYSLNSDGTVTIMKYVGNDEVVTVPAIIEGKPVIMIDRWAFIDNNTAKKCIISQGIQHIYCAAFGSSLGGNNSIESIFIPESVTCIDTFSLYLGAPFANCTSLKEIVVDPQNKYYSSEDGVLYNKEKTVLLAYPAGKTEKTFTVPEGIISIETEAFCGNQALTEIKLPNSLLYIEDAAFNNCKALQKVNCPKNLISIGMDAFYNCVNLSEVTIPDSVTDIGQNAFDETNVVNSQSSAIKYVGKWVVGFTDKTVENVTVKDGTVGIAQRAFDGKSALKSVKLPDSLLYINDNAFSYCKNLTNVTIGDKVKYIGRYAFYETAILENQDTAVKYIGNWLVGCDKDVTDVIVKEGTYGISSSAFSYSKLQTIVIPNSVKVILSEAFNGTPLIDSQSGDIKYADKWIIDCNEKATKVQIKEGTVGIADGAFSFCSNFTEVKLPDSLESIGDEAFLHCTGLKSVIIPVKVKNIAPHASGYIDPYTAGGYNNHQIQGFTLYVYSNTPGEKYAKVNGFTYELLPSKVTGVKLTGRAADALRINWTKNANADGYIVEMYQGNKWVRAAKITNSNTTTFRKAGLKAGTAYKFRVRSYKMEGKAVAYGAYSTELAARTNPSVMTGVKLTGRAADALRINWTKNASADGYIVEMYKGGKWVRAAKITNNSTTTFRKAGLKASTVYKFRVRAYKMSGKTALYGNYSATVTARTNPSIVKGVKIGGKAKDALRVNWAKNASAQGYIVEMYKGGKWVRVAKITNGNTTTFRKAGLAKNTAYKFRVKAYYMSGKTALYGNYGSVSGKTAAK